MTAPAWVLGKASSSFLQKRTKKLLFIKQKRCPTARAKFARVFASFFKKKGLLALTGQKGGSF
jgi:hypothetical protein